MNHAMDWSDQAMAKVAGKLVAGRTVVPVAFKGSKLAPSAVAVMERYGRPIESRVMAML